MQLMGNHRRSENNSRMAASNCRMQMLSTKVFESEFTMTETLNVSLLQAVFKLYLNGFIMSVKLF